MNNNIQIEKHDENWDESLMKVDFYKKCKDMRPFMGADYQQYKILLVCQSFGVAEAPTGVEQINADPKTWYGSSKEEIDKFIKDSGSEDWLDVRCHLGNISGHIWHHIATSIAEDREIISNQATWNRIYRCFALMNFFTRPSTGGDSFYPLDIDNTESYKTFEEVAKLIKPSRIIFLGKKGYEALIEHKTSAFDELEIDIDFTYSPIAAGKDWWATDGGKKKFIELVKEYKVI